MAFNLEKCGKKVCVIKNNTRYKKMNKIYVSNDKFEGDEAIKDFSDLEIQSGEFQLSPSVDTERITMYVCGESGSGKSYFVADYVREYHSIFPKNEVYMISEQEDDPVFDKLEYIKRVEIEGLDKDPIHFRDFDNSLVILDDCDAVKGKLGKSIDALRDKLLKLGRKYKISVIVTNHSCTGIEVKACLNECQMICFFMSGYNRSLKYLLENYIGLDKRAIEKLKQSAEKSRWTVYIKGFPSILVQQKFICTTKKLNS